MYFPNCLGGDGTGADDGAQDRRQRMQSALKSLEDMADQRDIESAKMREEIARLRKEMSADAPFEVSSLLTPAMVNAPAVVVEQVLEEDETKADEAKVNVVVNKSSLNTQSSSYAMSLETPEPQGMNDWLKDLADLDLARFTRLNDKFFYTVENLVASNPNNKFYFLALVVIFLMLTLSGLWIASENEDISVTEYDGHYEIAMFKVFQILMSGGYDASYIATGWLGRRTVQILTMLAGCLVFAVLVGFVNDSVASAMDSLNKGATNVAASNHTLILGWNESTVRCVCQIAFLRRSYKVQNETLKRRLLPWLRVPPSTPLAVAPIVILCDTKTKEEMEGLLQEAFLERGISPNRTKVGWDVVCRVGNPQDPHDLLRVAAHRAKRILTMMTTQDGEELERSSGFICGGASLRTLLALRLVALDPRGGTMPDAFWKDFRCVMQVQGNSPAIRAAKFNNPIFAQEAVKIVDLHAFVNSLLFNCTTCPGMANVLMDLLSFEGVAFRSQDAENMGLVGKKFKDCSNYFDDAVVVGVVSKLQQLFSTIPVFDEGLACNPERMITKDDRVLLVSATLSPKLAPAVEAQALPAVERSDGHPWDNLICGWRESWFDGARLRSRIYGMTRGLAKGSTILFLNMLDDASFAKVIEQSDMKPCGNLGAFGPAWDLDGIYVQHYHGDSCSLEVLDFVMRNASKKFESAVVLGTLAGVILPEESMDIRVLQTMVLVREAHAKVCPGTPIHVVGENCIDATADLYPRVGDNASRDFVNTQAIVARALTQALAYPVMQPAIAQLFNQTNSSSPQLLVSKACNLVPAGPAKFADVALSVARAFPGAICLGYLNAEDELTLCPPPGSVHDFQSTNKLIFIHRGLPLAA